MLKFTRDVTLEIDLREVICELSNTELSNLIDNLVSIIVDADDAELDMLVLSKLWNWISSDDGIIIYEILQEAYGKDNRDFLLKIHNDISVQLSEQEPVDQL